MITLKFPPTGGGEEHGLNDAGVETFEGEIGHYIARECAQNVCDATADDTQTVRLEFDLINLPTKDIPCRDQLVSTLNACKSFWSSNEKTLGFFEESIRIAFQENIKVLKISDFGTTGLSGNDDDRNDKWYCLVRSGGVSNKGGVAGGSFGIGKFAPFAASSLRTVLYSTRTLTGGSAFQGVSRLVSHKEASSGLITQGTGYLGTYDAQQQTFSAIRNNDDIPSIFQRSQPGTDVLVLAYKDEEHWNEDLKFSILSSFWPAILNKTIGFKIGPLEIDKDNLGSLLEQLSDQPDFQAHLYHKAATSGEALLRKGDIPGLGEVTLFLLPGDDSFPKRIAMTRKTGMVIELKHFKSRKPYAGYFTCASDAGNKLLRSLEPPRHDKWDRERGGKDEKKVLDTLYTWIREQIKALNPVTTASSLDVPELANYLPDDSNQSDEVSQKEVSEKGDDRGMNAHPRKLNLIPKRQESSTGLAGGTDGGEDGGSGAGNEPGDTIHKVTGDPNESDNNNPPPDSSGDGAQENGRNDDAHPKIMLRSFIVGKNTYNLVLRSTHDHEGSFKIVAIGDDGQAESINVNKITRDGKPLSHDTHGNINNLRLSAKKPVTLLMECESSVTLALKAVAL